MPNTDCTCCPCNPSCGCGTTRCPFSWVVIPNGFNDGTFPCGTNWNGVAFTLRQWPRNNPFPGAWRFQDPTNQWAIEMRCLDGIVSPGAVMDAYFFSTIDAHACGARFIKRFRTNAPACHASQTLLFDSYVFGDTKQPCTTFCGGVPASLTVIPPGGFNGCGCCGYRNFPATLNAMVTQSTCADIPQGTTWSLQYTNACEGQGLSVDDPRQGWTTRWTGASGLEYVIGTSCTMAVALAEPPNWATYLFCRGTRVVSVAGGVDFNCSPLSVLRQLGPFGSGDLCGCHGDQFGGGDTVTILVTE